MVTSDPNRVCLNCNSPVSGDFCSQCGQPISTHRYNFKHVFSHDFLYTVFHLKKGLFFSLKELLTRPGHSVREYVNGKRVNHLNYFALLLILIVAFSIIEGVTPFHYANLVDNSEHKEILEFFESLTKNNPKLFYIGVIPFYALFSLLIFRKSNMNYAENIVLNAYKSSAFLLFTIVFLSIASFVKSVSILKTLDSILGWIIVGYGTWFYYQYFSPYYKGKVLLFLRSLFCAIIPVIVILIGLLIYFASKQYYLDT